MEKKLKRKCYSKTIWWENFAEILKNYCFFKGKKICALEIKIKTIISTGGAEIKIYI